MPEKQSLNIILQTEAQLSNPTQRSFPDVGGEVTWVGKIATTKDNDKEVQRETESQVFFRKFAEIYEAEILSVKNTGPTTVKNIKEGRVNGGRERKAILECIDKFKQPQVSFTTGKTEREALLGESGTFVIGDLKGSNLRTMLLDRSEELAESKRR